MSWRPLFWGGNSENENENKSADRCSERKVKNKRKERLLHQTKYSTWTVNIPWRLGDFRGHLTVPVVPIISTWKYQSPEDWCDVTITSSTYSLQSSNFSGILTLTQFCLLRLWAWLCQNKNNPISLNWISIRIASPRKCDYQSPLSEELQLASPSFCDNQSVLHPEERAWERQIASPNSSGDQSDLVLNNQEEPGSFLPPGLTNYMV